MDDEKKVVALYYPQPNGEPTLLRGVLVKVNPDMDWINHKYGFLGKTMVKEMLHGNIRMLCGGSGKKANIELNSKTYYGDVLFVAYEDEKIVDIEPIYVKAIKAVVNKLPYEYTSRVNFLRAKEQKNGKN